MKHTRGILNQINSKPSFESMDIDLIPMVDAAEGPLLALESADVMNDVGGCIDEVDMLTQKQDNLATLVDYVEGEVNGPSEAGPLRTATQNEVALVEQAVAANTDGTGITEEEILPALESAAGSQIALEGVKDAIVNFGKGAAELVKKIGTGFANFMRILFTRLGALRSQIADVEKLIQKGELKTEAFDVSKSLGRYALLEGNEIITDSGKLATATGSLAQSLRSIGTEYPKQVLDQYDGIIKAIDIFFRKGEGRGQAKRDVRSEVTALIMTELKKTIALNEKVFKDAKLLGGLIINYDHPEVDNRELKSVLKSMRESRPIIGTAGNAMEREVTFVLKSKDDAKAIVNTIKGSLGLLGKFSSTDSMWNIAFFTGHFDPIAMLVDAAINGFETMGYKSLLSEMNQIYIALYTRPAMEMIDHFMRVSESQLSLLKKSFK